MRYLVVSGCIRYRLAVLALFILGIILTRYRLILTQYRLSVLALIIFGMIPTLYPFQASVQNWTIFQVVQRNCGIEE